MPRSTYEIRPTRDDNWRVSILKPTGSKYLTSPFWTGAKKGVARWEAMSSRAAKAAEAQFFRNDVLGSTPSVRRGSQTFAPAADRTFRRTVGRSCFEFPSSGSNSLPVFRLRKCSLIQTGQMITSYSVSARYGLSSDTCSTLSLVVGQMNMKLSSVDIYRPCFTNYDLAATHAQNALHRGAEMMKTMS